MTQKINPLDVLGLMEESQKFLKDIIKESFTELADLKRHRDYGLEIISQIKGKEGAFLMFLLLDFFTPRINFLESRLKSLNSYLFLLSNPKSEKSSFHNLANIARTIPIEDVAVMLGIKMKHYGKSTQAICPFHEDIKPSMKFYNNNSFYCFGCSQAGDSIDLVRKFKRCSFKEAISFILAVK